MKKIMSLLLAIVTMCVLLVPASAAVKDPVEPQYEHTRYLYAVISIDQNTGLATCGGDVCAKGWNPVKVVVQLQQLKDGVWRTLQTWTNTGTMYTEQTGHYYVMHGYVYRTKVTSFVYDNNGRIIESASGTDQRFY